MPHKSSINCKQGEHSQVERERCASSSAKKEVCGQSPCLKCRTASARKSRKSERQKIPTEVSGNDGGQYGDGGGRENTGRARRRRRRVRESFCADGECASSWQTNEKFAALFSVDERFGLVTARPDFQLPRSPSRS
eukprot:3077764-Pleurochrysis_carterae.AAC.1